MSKWIGYAVSVNCGEPLGCYQGTILQADGSSITLTKAFRNGFPYPKSQVTLNAADIKELKIIEAKAERSEQTHSTVTVAKNKKGARATVCESLQNNPSNSGNQPSQSTVSGTGAKGNRSANNNVACTKPIDIQQNTTRTNKNNTHSTQTGSYGNTGSTPKVRHNTNSGMRRRDEACFGDGAEPAVQEFDFEGNLALFDKQALWEQMSSRPDVVLPAAQSARPVSPVRCLSVPVGLRGSGRYLTEGGLLVPSASQAARHQLWRSVHRRGLLSDARLLMARAIADVCLRLIGGWRRLEKGGGGGGGGGGPMSGGSPCVGAVVGRGAAGVGAAQALRLLTEHQLNVALHVAEPIPPSPELSRELSLLSQCGCSPRPLEALPNCDVIILALHDPLDTTTSELQYPAVLDWCSHSRGNIILIEPSCAAPLCSAPRSTPRAALCQLWPAFSGGAARLYLVPSGAPREIYDELNMPPPPFGGCSLLPLYPDN